MAASAPAAKPRKKTGFVAVKVPSWINLLRAARWFWASKLFARAAWVAHAPALRLTLFRAATP